jgi:hypothetical protein
MNRQRLLPQGAVALGPYSPDARSALSGNAFCPFAYCNCRDYRASMLSHRHQKRRALGDDPVYVQVLISVAGADDDRPNKQYY